MFWSKFSNVYSKLLDSDNDNLSSYSKQDLIWN